jgi:molybdate/tungstate transport system substrate-binding protein
MSFRTLMNAMTRTLSGALLAGFVLLGLAGPAGAEPSGTLTIYHAGSLTGPVKQMIQDFNKQYPKVTVATKAGGSTKMARLISDGGEMADIMASADFVVIDKNLIPKFATWNARFASNQIVLCYTEASRMKDTITPGNWYEVLQTKGVVWGHSDPNLDPCGYRSLMTLQLAEKFYGKPGLYDAVIANRPAENVRPKAKELVSMLKDGKMDYAFEYLSVAVQQGLDYIPLDSHVNLGDMTLDAYYKTAKVTVTGKEPGTTVDRLGSSITYGVTMLDKAPNPEAAEAFLGYLFSIDGGLRVLDSMGQPPFIPVNVPTQAMLDAMPASLKGKVAVSK